jgi:WD40 repeat protein
VAFDGTIIVSGSEDNTVLIWRAPYSTGERYRVTGEHISGVHLVWLCTAPNDHIVVSASMAQIDRYGKDKNKKLYRVHVHDIRTGDRVCTPIDSDICKLS